MPSLSPKEAEVLAALGSGERFGLQVVEESNGAIARGTIYVTLGRMEEKDFVTSRADPSSVGQPGMPRRLYRATALGQAALEAREALAAVLAGSKVIR